MFAVIMAGLAFASPADAAPYTNEATTSVSSQTPTAGSRVKFCGLGFLPGERVNIILDQSRGSHGTRYPSVVAKGASGEFCTTIVLGANLIGAHSLTATGTTSGRTSTTKIRVLSRRHEDVSVLGASASAGTASAGTGGLAFTGADAIATGALGGLLLLGGGAMVFVGKRRKDNA